MRMHRCTSRTGPVRVAEVKNGHDPQDQTLNIPMSEERNTLPWPSIEQLPREVCHRINRFLSVADTAAVVIQRAHRGASLRVSSKAFRGGYRSRLHSFLTSEPIFLGEKLDGTNVGKCMDGTLLGRRLVIEDDARSYQRCDLTTLRGLRADCVLDDLIALGGGGDSIRRAALYGELCCNPGLYSYAAMGLAKSWQAFGALLEFQDEVAAAAYAHAASASGLVCNVSDSRVVRLCNNAKFGEVSRRHEVPAVRAEPHASLCAAVAMRGEWMVSEQGEGLVMSISGGVGRASLYKWKISREPQPAAIDELAELLEALRSGADGKACLLDAQIHQMIRTLHAVATHEDSTKAAGATSEKPAKKAPQAIVGAAAVERAIASALTKFDSLETTFEAHGQSGVGTIAERLVAEVLSDNELVLPAEGDAGREAALKAVATAVKRFVGQAFGSWRKEQAARRTIAASG